MEIDRNPMKKLMPKQGTSSWLIHRGSKGGIPVSDSRVVAIKVKTPVSVDTNKVWIG